ncbi:MAG: hypothetical protein V1913_16245 [Fibrobacterota bacterium]
MKAFLSSWQAYAFGSAFFAALFLKEAITWKVALGGSLVAAGAVLLAL